MKDSAEFVAGTAPTDAGSLLEITQIKYRAMADGEIAVELSWTSAAGRMDTLESGSSPDASCITIVTGEGGSPPVNTYAAPLSDSVTIFYRVRVQFLADG